MKYVLNSKQMKDCDLAEISGNINKSLELIDRASSACIKHLHEDGFNLKKTLVACGGGNNGADGFAIAKKLIDDNFDVVVVVPVKDMRFSPEAEILKAGLDVIDSDEFNAQYKIAEFTCIVDAVFGIGLSRDLSGKFLELIEKINASGVPVLSVDIPSGVHSDNGCVLKGAVNALVTVTFACIKTGQLIYPGRKYCGKLYVEDIGIPVLEVDKNEYCVTDLFEYKNLLPKRSPWGNKGTFGKVLVVAGSDEIFGACYLSAMAAYKSGCGMVHILTEKNNMYSLQQMLPEALLHFYDGKNSEDVVNKLKAVINSCDYICAGCGLGTSDVAVDLMDFLLDIDKPMVLDADALNIIAKNNWLYRLKSGNYILTPHIMEMSRLSGLSCDEIKKNIVSVAKEFAEKYNVTLVLKDAVSVVSSRHNNTYINRTGNSGMAKAGSGDVLAGIITGLMAQKMKFYEAACLGVYLHGLSGDVMVKETGEYGLLARNLIDGIEIIRKNGD